MSARRHARTFEYWSSRRKYLRKRIAAARLNEMPALRIRLEREVALCECRGRALDRGGL